MAGCAVDPLMRDSLAAGNARNKPKLRKEAGFADKGLNLRKFGSESLGEAFHVNQIGE